MPRASLISLAAALNSLTERVNSSPKIDFPIPKAPIFIIGHWRSGTTLLHELLALVPEFVAPTTVDVFFPYASENAKRRLGWLFDTMVPEDRIIDRMAVSATSPQEEEFALAQMTGMSPYLTYCFPRAAQRYESYLDFDGVDEEAIERWFVAYESFAGRLQMEHCGRLLFKSPPSTARIGLLASRYPDARFLHISREPSEIIQSTLRMLKDSIPMAQLQSFEFGSLEQLVFDRARKMYARYFDAATGLAGKRLLEIRFEDLIEKPRPTLRAVLNFLGPDEPTMAWEKLLDELKNRSGYQRNCYPQPTPRILERLCAELAPYYQRFGYTLPPPSMISRANNL